MSEWREIAIGTYLKLTSGFPFASEHFSNEGFPLIRIRDVLSSTTETYFKGTFPPGYIIKKGNILIGMDGDFHVVKWQGCDALLNQRVLKVDVVDESIIALDFVYHWLGPFVKKINETTAATTVKHLSTKDILKAKVDIPNVYIQRKIASILTSIDTTIEKTEALIAKYQQIKAGLMHDLFTRGVLANGQLRPPREQAPELYQKTAIGWIPKEWITKDLGSACDWYSGGTPSKRVEKWWNGSFPWLSPKDMKQFELGDTEDHVTREAAQIGSRIMPPNSVFIVVRGMILAHSFPVVLSTTEFSFNQDVKAIIGKAQLDNRFLAFWMVANTELFLRKTTEATHGTKRFESRDLYEIIIGIPKPSEQKRIVLRLNSLEIRIAFEKNQLKKLRTQKLGLMQDLLSGRVAVQINQPEKEST